MSDSKQANATPSDCPLPVSQQTRNLLIYGVNVGLVYLSAPALYLIIQPALLERLQASKTISNLPNSVYFFATPLPILVAWLFPQVRQIKPVLAACFVITAAVGALVALSLVMPTPAWAASAIESLNAVLPKLYQLPIHWVVPALILHGGITGLTLGAVSCFQWEVLGRGVSAARRGQTLALAFGFMPALAFISTSVSQMLLGGDLFGLSLPRVEFPWNFALLFGATAPAMLLAASLALGYVVPRPAVEVARQPFVQGVFGGLGQFLRHRQILTAALGMILVGAGYNIITNITLYTQKAMGAASEEYVGYQGMLRFGFKIGVGIALGWLLTRTNPKLPMLATAGFALASVLWAWTVPGVWFLLSFGLMGGGELFGVYYPNYILNCSPKSKMRRNMAFGSMLNMSCAFAAVAYGNIADLVSIEWSFAAATLVLIVTLLVVQFGLPARPRHREEDMEESDRAQAAT